MSVNCAEFIEQVAAHALRSLDPDESAAMDAHLAEKIAHAGCREALDAAFRVVGILASSMPPVEPSAAAWRAIELRLGRPSPRRNLREVAAWAIAAAASLALVWTRQGSIAEQARLREASARSGEEITRVREQQVALTRGAEEDRAAREACVRELEAVKGEETRRRDALVMLDAPGSRVVALGPAGKRPGRASAVVDLRSGRAFIISSSLPRVPDKDYQLWVIRGKAAPEPAGFLRFDKGGTAIGEVDRRVLTRRVDAFAVSLEPLGGRPKPTEVVLVGALKG